jgi:endopeptidase La
LHKEYQKYSGYLKNFQDHVEICSREGIISISDRNSNLKIINDLLKSMNVAYNANMVDICENDSDEVTETDMSSAESLAEIFPLIGLSNLNNSNIFEDIGSLIDLCKILNLDMKDTKNGAKYQHIFKEPFDEVKKTMLEKIAIHIGFHTVADGLELLIGNQYDKVFDKDMMQQIEFYNKVFIPLSYRSETIEGEEKLLFFKKKELDRDVLLENCADLYINKVGSESNQYIIFAGYFSYDPLNLLVKTAQICHDHIFQKKRQIETYVNEIKPANDKFTKSYLRNASISDILILTKEEYLQQLESDYLRYNDLSKLSFMNLMKEFVREDKGGKLKDTTKDDKFSIKHMYQIIKLLLLGTDENVNVAGLLFGISKDKKPGSECPISDIIYRNLSYISQTKLRKTSINIKNELEKIRTMTVDDVDLKKQVTICKNMPVSTKRAAIEKIEEMKSSNNEYSKQLLYVKTLLNYPWPSAADDTFFEDIGRDNKRSKDFLDNIILKLNDSVYGHNECKETVKELIGKWITNPSSAGTALGLVGPPGVGKTLIAKAIGQALDIPFVQITLGGQNDGELLHGHGYTYSGAQPGMVVKKMIEAGSARCIMYFDELDKACKKHDTNEIYSILIHMIDPNTNDEFQDRFFQEVTFPLHKVLFIFSYNDSSLIDGILMDRVKEIEVKPFKLQDKKTISTKFLIKEMCKLVGFEPGSIILDDKDIEYLIDQYTHEAGVRELKRMLEKIFLKMNIDRIYRTNDFIKGKNATVKKPIKITQETIKRCLGKEHVDIQKIHEEDLIGVISGLYATESGKGGVLPIQVFPSYSASDEKFTLKLTGNQKCVMRESVMSAFTTAVHHVREDLRIQFISQNPHGLHIHTPSAAVPKDGPSAGSAFTTAFASRILNKKIKHDVAMTGEIELTGKITRIGGLQYKLTGAKRAGVKLVLVPLENKDDLDSIKKEYGDLFTGDFEVKTVDHISEVFALSLVDFDPACLA